VRQKEVWKIIGNPGVLLADGEIAATWRTKATGRKRLDFTISAFETLPPAVRKAAEAETDRVATARGFPTSASPGPSAPSVSDIAPDVDIWRFEYFRCNRWWELLRQSVGDRNSGELDA